MTATDPHGAIDAVWRIESARIIAGLTRILRDVGVAEELAQDALVAALEQWQIAYLPVYSVWAALVVVVFPPVFGYR